MRSAETMSSMSYCIFVLLITAGWDASSAQETGEDPETTSKDLITTAITTEVSSLDPTQENLETTTSPIATTSIVTNDITITTEGQDIVITTAKILTTTNLSTETKPITEIMPISTTTVSADSMCEVNVCHNGGSCILTADNDFKCICEPGFVGETCQTEDFCDKDNEGVLCGDGACVFNEDLSFRRCKCFEGKYWNPENKDCEEVEEPCFPNPCKNGGTCTKGASESYTCSCTEGYTGTNCHLLDFCLKDENGVICGKGECIVDSSQKSQNCKCNDGFYLNPDTNTCQNIDLPCKPNPCNGQGSCQSSASKDYNCTCDSPYYGTNCEYLNLCPNDGKSCPNGTCTLQKESFTMVCLCNPGFYLAKHSGKCNAIQKPCLPNPCVNNGACTALSAEAYNCTCSEGFMGKDCTSRNRCKLDGGQKFCQGSLCAVDFDRNTFYCKCLEDEYFDYHQRKCLAIDLCPMMKCGKNQKCSNSKCECERGYKMKNGSTKCEPDFCTVYGCPGQNMQCLENLDSPEDFRCFCTEGQTYNGTACRDAVCTFPSLNHCSLMCSPANEGYNCSCDVPLILNEDHKTCNIPEENHCQNTTTCGLGICVKEGSTEKCVCPSGYVEEEGQCVDLCTAKKLPKGLCPNDACSSDIILGFKCVCPKKYQQSSDRVTCIHENPCAVGGNGAKVCQLLNAHCVREFSSEEGYYCQCNNGYLQAPDGHCRSICDFEDRQKKCSQKGATCVADDTGSFSCRCPPTFAMGKSGICNELAEFSFIISLPLDIKTYLINQGKASRTSLSHSEVDYSLVTKDMKDSLERFFGGFLYLNVLNCKNANDFIHCKAEVQLQYLAFGENFNRLIMPSSHYENASLIHGITLVPPSLLLKSDRIKSYAAFQKSDPCHEDVKEELCEPDTVCTNNNDNNNNGFTCTCKPGFLVRLKTYPINSTSTFIESCRDVDECSEVQEPCPSSAKCFNTPGSYQCLCLPGFKENNVTSEGHCIELCNPNPCLHGQCAASGDHTFECRCEAGYAGSLCNFEDKNYKGARINTVIVGVVLGGILLITIILFIASVARLRRQKYLESSNQILYSTEMTEQRSVVLSAANPAFERD